ncbi:hypothetical protein [Bartonella sp. MM73XJBT.G]|uniref:hypothetical protein n=1 Tax=Bartonella sp. MM73XJBT.G TaxID=3019097 RepID=UPI00235E4A3D|nr:hypothetical protein [Bartonella sp. MM73XJBT.G]
MRYSKKKSFALLNTVIWIALRLIRNPLLNRIGFFWIALRDYTVISNDSFIAFKKPL